MLLLLLLLLLILKYCSHCIFKLFVGVDKGQLRIRAPAFGRPTLLLLLVLLLLLLLLL